MDNSIGREVDGRLMFITQSFWQAGHEMRAIYDLDMETAGSQWEDRELKGCLVFLPAQGAWLPDGALLTEFVAPLDLEPGRGKTLEGQLAKALGR